MRTEYFDYVFETRNNANATIEDLEFKLDRNYTKLNNLLSKDKIGERRQAKIDELQETIARREQKLNDMEEVLADLSGVQLPVDELSSRIADGLLYFDVTDSPYDATFSGGDELVYRWGAETSTPLGTKRRYSTGNLGTYWPETGDEYTYLTGSSSLTAAFTEFDTLTTYIAAAPEGDSWDEKVSNAEFIVLDTFNL